MKNTTSEQSSHTRPVGGSKKHDDQWNEVRLGVWFLASELHLLNDLQLFAEMVEPSDPIDIKRTAQILAKAQLELRALLNNRKATSSGNV